MQHTHESKFLPLKPTSAAGYKGIYHQIAPLCEETMWKKNSHGNSMILLQNESNNSSSPQ